MVTVVDTTDTSSKVGIDDVCKRVVQKSSLTMRGGLHVLMEAMIFHKVLQRRRAGCGGEQVDVKIASDDNWHRLQWQLEE
jgi:hypothetical protein